MLLLLLLSWERARPRSFALAVALSCGCERWFAGSSRDDLPVDAFLRTNVVQAAGIAQLARGTFDGAGGLVQERRDFSQGQRWLPTQQEKQLLAGFHRRLHPPFHGRFRCAGDRDGFQQAVEHEPNEHSAVARARALGECPVVGVLGQPKPADAADLDCPGLPPGLPPGVVRIQATHDHQQ